MTGTRGLYVNVDGSSNGTTPVNARIALAGLLASSGAALAFRPGVFYDGLGNVVSGNTDTGTMSYSVRACQFAMQLLGTTASGAVVGANDAVFKANTTAAPGSNSRIDVIWVRQHAVAADGGPDTDNIMEIKVTQGTPAASPTVPTIPTGAMALAQAIMPAGATSTNSLTITQVHNWTTSDGSDVPVRNQTERDAMTAYLGQTVTRLDLGGISETYNGSAWLRSQDPYPQANLVNRPRRILTRNATFSLADSVITAVGTWSADSGDDGNSTGLSLSGTFITVTYGGLYDIDFTMAFPSNATGVRACYMMKNGTVGPPAAGTQIGQTAIAGTSGGNVIVPLHIKAALSAGDTLQPAVFQNSGGALTCGSTVPSIVRWSVERVGP